MLTFSAQVSLGTGYGCFPGRSVANPDCTLSPRVRPLAEIAEDALRDLEPALATLQIIKERLEKNRTIVQTAVHQHQALAFS